MFRCCVFSNLVWRFHIVISRRCNSIMLVSSRDITTNHKLLASIGYFSNVILLAMSNGQKPAMPPHSLYQQQQMFPIPETPEELEVLSVAVGGYCGISLPNNVFFCSFSKILTSVLLFVICNLYWGIPSARTSEPATPEQYRTPIHQRATRYCISRGSPPCLFPQACTNLLPPGANFPFQQPLPVQHSFCPFLDSYFWMCLFLFSESFGVFFSSSQLLFSAFFFPFCEQNSLTQMARCPRRRWRYARWCWWFRRPQAPSAGAPRSNKDALHKCAF